MHCTQTAKHIKHTSVGCSCFAHLLDTQLLQTKARSKSQFYKQGGCLINLPNPLGSPAELGWQFFSVLQSSHDRKRVSAPFPQLCIQRLVLRNAWRAQHLRSLLKPVRLVFLGYGRVVCSVWKVRPHYRKHPSKEDFQIYFFFKKQQIVKAADHTEWFIICIHLISEDW